MPKIKALKNVGAAGAFRLLRENREIDLPDDKVNAGVIRLWKKGSIVIDGEAYSASSKYVPKEEKTPAVKTDTAVKKEEVKETEEATSEAEEVKTEETRELKVEDTEPPAQPEKEETTEPEPEEGVEPVQDIEPPHTEDVVDSDGTDDSEEKTEDKAEEPAEDKTEEDKGDAIAEYVLSQAPGFFTYEALAKKKLNVVREIGEKVGIEVKTKKKGAKDIANKVADILAQ